MRRLHTWILLICLSLVIGKANAEILYKAQYGQQTWWIIGTIHIGGPDLVLSKRSQQAVRASSEIWMELEPSELEQAAMLMMRYGITSTPISQQVPAELWQRLEQRLAKESIAAAMFNNLQPWLFEVFVSMQIAQAEGFSAEQGVEMQIMQWLQDNPKKIRGFETAQLQIDSIMAAAADNAEEMIERLLVSLDDDSQQIGNLAAVWQSGDLAGLMTILSDSMTAEQLDALLWQRNLAWFEQMQGMLDKQDNSTRTIAVGAGHLGAELGLLALLQSAGVSIENYSTGVAR